MDRKPTSYTCMDCTYLDMNVHDTRMYHVGFCRRFSSTEPKAEPACNQFLHTELPDWSEIEAQNTPLTRIAEAKAIQTYLEL